MAGTPLTWDVAGQHFFETGVKKGVLWVQGSNGEYGKGVAWSGLTSVSESPSGADENALYADNIKYLSLRGTENFGGTIEAYQYPDEWMECDGSKEATEGLVLGQQGRATFAFSFVTQIGNDAAGSDYGYKIHIIYGATATPSQRSYQTINDSPEAITFSWEFTTVPVAVDGYKPVSVITIDSKKVAPEKLATLEALLYGSNEADSSLPTPAEVIATLQ